MDTREIEELSQWWSEQELTAALVTFIDKVGRLPRSGELSGQLACRLTGTV